MTDKDEVEKDNLTICEDSSEVIKTTTKKQNFSINKFLYSYPFNFRLTIGSVFFRRG
jgi:hypothetical protein